MKAELEVPIYLLIKNAMYWEASSLSPNADAEVMHKAMVRGAVAMPHLSMGLIHGRHAG